MNSKALPALQLDPIPLPFMESKIKAVAKMVAGFSYLEYTVQPITREKEQDSLTVLLVTINKTARHKFLNHVPSSTDGKLPHWEEIGKVVCAKASSGCCKPGCVCPTVQAARQRCSLCHPGHFARQPLPEKGVSRVRGVCQKCVRIREPQVPCVRYGSAPARVEICSQDSTRQRKWPRP